MTFVSDVRMDVVRARWPQAHETFGPLNGWPTHTDPGYQVSAEGLVYSRGRVAGALAVVASRYEYWEAQALVVAYSSARQTLPHEHWPVLATIDRSVPEPDTQLQLVAFSKEVGVELPFGPLAAAGRTMLMFDGSTLDRVGWVVAQMSAGSLDDCWEQCGTDLTCLDDCIARLA